MAVVSSETPLASQTVQAVEGLLAQASLALERAQLAEDVHRQRVEARFRSLVQNATDLITVIDADATIRYQSPSVRRVLGYDMYRDPVRHQAMDAAARTGTAAATGGVRLMQDLGEERPPLGFLIYVPVFRERELTGFVYSPFRTADTIRRAYERLVELGDRADSIRAVEPARQGRPTAPQILVGDHLLPVEERGPVPVALEERAEDLVHGPVPPVAALPVPGGELRGIGHHAVHRFQRQTPTWWPRTRRR